MTDASDASGSGNHAALVDAFMRRLGAAPPLGGPAQGAPHPSVSGLLQRLVGTKIHRDCDRSLIKALNQERTDLANRVKGMDDQSEAALTQDVDALVLKIGDANAFALAVVPARASLAATRSIMMSLQPNFTPNQLEAFQAKQKGFEASLAAATQVPQLTQILAEAQAMEDEMRLAETFADDLDRWRREKLVIVSLGSDPDTHQQAMAVYTSLESQAIALADQAQFNPARAVLDQFDTQPFLTDGTQPDFAAAQTYAQAYADFQQNHIKKWSKLVDRDFGGSKAWETDYAAIKALAVQKNFHQATADLGTLATFTDDMTAAFDLRARYANLLTKNAAVDHAELDMIAAVTIKDPAAALAAYAALQVGGNEELELLSLIEAARAEKNDRASGSAAQTVLNAGLNKAANAMQRFQKANNANPTDDAGATAAAQLVRDALQDAQDALPVAEAFDSKRALILQALEADPSLIQPLDLRRRKLDGTSMKKHKTAAKLNQAEPQLDAALAILDDLIEARRLRAIIEKLPVAFPVSSPERAECEDVLQQADGQAPADAVATLTAYWQSSNFEALLADISAFYQAKDAAEARMTKALGFARRVPPPGDNGLSDALRREFDQATALGEVNRQFSDAVDAFEHSKDSVRKIQVLASLFGTALSLAKAVRRDAPVEPLPRFDAQINAIAGNAAGDLDGATQAVGKLIGSMDALVAQKSRDLETADAAGSNAGHSLARHGPDIHTDTDALLGRLQTGVVPDTADKSFCPASSAFANVQDWLAGREMAMQAAMAADKPMNPNAVTLPPPALERYLEDVDFGRPIDRAFIGVKPNVVAQPDGSVQQDGSYETYVETDGITMARVLFTFQFDNPDGGPKNVIDRADYENRWEAAHGDLSGATYAGRWVMMQQFPLVEGWDPETKSYV